MTSSWRDVASGMVTLTNVGDPPPPYTENEGQGQGQRGRLTLSVSWEPPPVYDIATITTPLEVCKNRSMRPEVIGNNWFLSSGGRCQWRWVVVVVVGVSGGEWCVVVSLCSIWNVFTDK